MSLPVAAEIRLIADIMVVMFVIQGLIQSLNHERVKALSEACLDRSYYDEDDYETSAARGEREYFSDDPARDYNLYYAQVADAADMGNLDAIDEMRGEFGEGGGVVI